jgi:hypothetical protein
LHPGVFAYLKWSPLVSPFILDGVAQGIMAEGVMINKDAKDFMQPAFGMYEKAITVLQDASQVDLRGIIASDGSFLGQNHLGYWKSIVENKIAGAHFLASLVPVAALLLAQPAAEAIDESSFSAAGQILTKHRVSLSPVTVESKFLFVAEDSRRKHLMRGTSRRKLSSRRKKRRRRKQRRSRKNEEKIREIIIIIIH